MRGVTTRTTVELDLDADRWELFDEDGREAAAADLTTTLQGAINAPGSTARSVREAMRAACRRHGALGAEDGEADRLIERVLAKVYGEDA